MAYNITQYHRTTTNNQKMTPKMHNHIITNSIANKTKAIVNNTNAFANQKVNLTSL